MQPSESTTATNPYAAPTANLIPAASEAENIRTAHVQHENSIKTVGVLYCLGGILLAFASAIYVLLALAKADEGGPVVGPAIIGSLFVAIGAGQVFAGFALRKLKSWARVVTTVLSAIGLIGFPIGTIINGYILYLLWCKKGNLIFTDEYQLVVAETPHVKVKQSGVALVILGLLVAGIVGLVVLGRR